MQRILPLVLMPTMLVLSTPAVAIAATLTVGPGKTYAAPCAAFAAAADGDLIEIDAGLYSGDVCTITRNNLTIRGVGGGRAHIDAAGMNAGGKAIWVIAGNDTIVENVELSGATVPDQNGAGIRQEGANLTVIGCYFHDNENGILTGANPGSEIYIESSEFANNGFGDGYSHNMYIGAVAKFTLQSSWTHDASVGHNVKSRAAENYILYNRITDEAGGTASYEINLPNGGTSYVVGNIVQQSGLSQNPAMLAYGEEGLPHPGTDLHVINNTFVNDLGGGTFVQIGAGALAAVITNNIFAGGGTPTNQANAVLAGNFEGDPLFVDAAGLDWHLQAGSPAVDTGVDPGSDAPTSQYVHPLQHEGRLTVGTIDVGAFELGGGTPAFDAGPNGPDGGAAAPDAGGGGGGGSDEGGCGCRTSARHDSPLGAIALIVFAALALVRRRRRDSRTD